MENIYIALFSLEKLRLPAIFDLEIKEGVYVSQKIRKPASGYTASKTILNLNRTKSYQHHKGQTKI